MGITLNDESLSKKVTIAHNPVASSFEVIQYPSAPLIKSMSICDLSGREICSFKETTNANISQLKNGIYFLQMKFITGQQVIKKLVKK